jgi:hypothetical protein
MNESIYDRHGRVVGWVTSDLFDLPSGAGIEKTILTQYMTPQEARSTRGHVGEEAALAAATERQPVVSSAHLYRRSRAAERTRLGVATIRGTLARARSEVASSSGRGCDRSAT